MSSINASTRGNDHRFDPVARTAGGSGAPAAKATPLAKLRRLGLTALMWENSAYQSGSSVAKDMAALIPQCDPTDVAALAIESREEQGLRHTPLFLLRELIRYPAARKAAGEALAKVMTRPDQVTEFLAMYWADAKTTAGKRRMLPHQVKKAISKAFNGFDAYQLAKYDRAGKAVGLRDAMFMAHVEPSENTGFRPEHRKVLQGDGTDPTTLKGFLTPKEGLWFNFVEDKLPVPVTRETALSAATTTEAKAAAYTNLIETKKIGADAMVKSIRHMIEVGVPGTIIRQGLAQINPERLLPLNFLAAMREAPAYESSLEELMLRCLKRYPELPGKTLVVMDVSGSMGTKISAKSTFTRLDAGLAMCMMIKEMSPDCTIYLTAGSDYGRFRHNDDCHKTELVPGTLRGLALQKHAHSRVASLGGGGIFTRQALKFIRTQHPDVSFERTIVVSDSQDCDAINKVPTPFAKYNYITDVAAHTNGINYKGVWTAEISGWSQSFLHYIAEYEKLSKQWTLFD